MHFSVSQHQSDMLREDTLVITGCRKESNLIDDHDFGYPSTGAGNNVSKLKHCRFYLEKSRFVCPSQIYLVRRYHEVH